MYFDADILASLTLIHDDWSFYLVVGDLQVVIRVACSKFILNV